MEVTPRARAASRARRGLTFVDFDRDGNLDLWVTQYEYSEGPVLPSGAQQDRLYRGDGTGKFVEVTQDVGLTTTVWSSVSDLNTGSPTASRGDRARAT